ncbi:helix-turn-helix domain-containing protein [Listeria valentina]|uniref:helix-turn-helix domain-containing protein n=1 Tax=Listeria valentina TaxID=2705293 RepID=UPI001430690A|nr:helix-turn-helix transcriptional regulator [Listeria valentina]
MTIGKKIAELRKKRGLSQSNLAKDLNVSTSTVGMWETNKREPDYETLKKITYYFNVSADYLLGIEGTFNYEEFNDDDLVAAHTDSEIDDTDEEINAEVERFKKYLLEEKAKKNKK